MNSIVQTGADSTYTVCSHHILQKQCFTPHLVAQAINQIMSLCRQQTII